MRRVTDLLNLIYYANKCLKKELEKPLFRLWDAKNKKTITGHWINMFTDKIIKEINAIVLSKDASIYLICIQMITIYLKLNPESWKTI